MVKDSIHVRLGIRFFSLAARLSHVFTWHSSRFTPQVGLPVCVLLGGRFGEDYPLYRAISQGTPEEMVGLMMRGRGHAKSMRAARLL